ncbi:MBL fold metallo-hydrolase [Chitinimonas taiwanensis]|uniref:MBL fold metallo-hydrolase n=1 Tax=Chitinimonas taiwanensis TaxID=240412 RepID=UPI0035B0A24F
MQMLVPLALFVLFSTPLLAQSPRLKQHSAQQTLEKALAAHGGAARIAAASGLSYQLEGGFYAPLQAPGYQGPFEPLPLSARYVFDWAGQRSAIDSKLVFPGGFTLHSRELAGPESVRIDHAGHAFSRNTPLSLAANAFRYHPLPLLRQLQHPDAELSDGGEDEFFGSKVRRLTARWPGLATGLEVLVDADTGLIAGYRQPRSYPLQPKGVNTVRFLDYHELIGLRLPAKVSGETLSEPRLGFELALSEQTLGPAPADAFAVPADYIEVPAESALGPYVRELAPDVHLVERLGGQDYAALVLVFDDAVTVVEAPLNEQAGQQLLAAVEQIAPGKPIKTLVLSHHHDDHLGGMVAVIDRGARVLAPAGAEATLRAIYAAKHPGRALAFTAIAAGQKMLLADAHHQVELYNLSDNPHAEQILALYIPSAKLLFQADLFTNHAQQAANAPANEGGIALVRWLKAQGIQPERIAGVHGTVASRADINHMLSKAKSDLRL